MMMMNRDDIKRACDEKLAVEYYLPGNHRIASTWSQRYITGYAFGGQLAEVELFDGCVHEKVGLVIPSTLLRIMNMKDLKETSTITARLHGISEEVLKLIAELEETKKQLKAAKDAQTNTNADVSRLFQEKQTLAGQFYTYKLANADVTSLRADNDRLTKEADELRQKLHHVDSAYRLNNDIQELQRLRSFHGHCQSTLNRANAEIHALKTELDRVREASANLFVCLRSRRDP